MTETDTCQYCGLERQPAHFGSPRKCAFKEESFDGGNWNCGLISPIRQAFSDGDGRTSLHYRDDEVSTYGVLVVAIPEYDEFWGHGYGLAGLLVGSWYKERGAVDDLKWAFRARGGGEGDALTRTEAQQIGAWLRAREESEADQSLAEASPVLFISSSHMLDSTQNFRAQWEAASQSAARYLNSALPSTSAKPPTDPAPGKKPKRRFPISR